MPPVRWIGPLPSRARRAALLMAGFQLAPEAPVAVVATAAPRVPTAPAGTAWLWLSARPVPHEAVSAAILRGAYDVVEDTDAQATTARLAERLKEMTTAESEPEIPEGVIAGSPAARRLLRTIARAAATAFPVLLAGETGTGKEVTAALIHRWSRRPGPYLPINCAAIPNELMESELFGHIKGAYSGATATVDGKLLSAQAGTVFLDEIDDTPPSVQTKLLRALEDGEITRVGESQPRKSDFRLIAATNRNLLHLIAEGRFGLDFYERLAIVRIDLPRLADRREDIPAFARHFMARFYQRAGLPVAVSEIDDRVFYAFEQHPWPGNIRELRNVIYQALANKKAGRVLLLSDIAPLLAVRLHPEAQDASHALVNTDALRASLRNGGFNLKREIEHLETLAVSLSLSIAGGSPARAARLLGEVGHGRSRDPGGTVRAMMRRLKIKAGPAS